MGRKKTKRKKKQMKGGVDVKELVTNLLQCGGLLSMIKPLNINEYTEIAGYLDTIEADTYNSDEYWILLALTGGLSKCNRFINTRIKTYFRIQNILDKDDESFNTDLNGILVAWNDSKNDNSVDPWQRRVDKSKVKWEAMNGQIKNGKTFENFVKCKTGIDNIETFWKRAQDGYYCKDNVINLLNNWNSITNNDPRQMVSNIEEKDIGRGLINEIETELGLKGGVSKSLNKKTDDSRKSLGIKRHTIKKSNKPIINNTLDRCISIGFDPKIKPTFPATGCPAPRAVPTAGQWDREIDKLAQRFVGAINSDNEALLNQIFNPSEDNLSVETSENNPSESMDTEGGGKKRKKKKSKKKKKTKKKKKSKKRR